MLVLLIYKKVVWKTALRHWIVMQITIFTYVILYLPMYRSTPHFGAKK